MPTTIWTLANIITSQATYDQSDQTYDESGTTYDGVYEGATTWQQVIPEA